VRNVVLDTGAADFAERTAALARGVLSQGPVSAVSCVGVGSGSMRWSEEELQRVGKLVPDGTFTRAEEIMIGYFPSWSCFPPASCRTSPSEVLNESLA
jgi:hypothetical protein